MQSHPRRSAPSNLRIVPAPSSSVADWNVVKSADRSSSNDDDDGNNKNQDSLLRLLARKMNSPLGSPKIAASTAKLRNRVPTQVKRCLSLYLGLVCIALLVLNMDLFDGLSSTDGGGIVLHKETKTVAKPPAPGSTFPQKIWQTWKVGPLGFEERDLLNARTWLDKNPGMRYEVLTDANEMSYVEQHFGPSGFNRPDIVEFYRNIKLPIIKADLLRYMIMYAEGGVYADIDVEALKPVSRFIPERYDESEIDLVVGIEIDEPSFKDHPILGQKSMSFCQWTFMAKPGHPVMLHLVENIMSWLNGVAHEQKVSVGDVKLDFDQVISGTGPSAFTIALLAEINRNSDGPQVTWDNFHNMDESKVVGRVLVLNVEAFCAGQGHSNSGNHDARGAMVKHHYHASNWPSRHQRYTHPAYGPVEMCNWDAECVRTWDENVAEFERLPNEQKRLKVNERNGELVPDQ